MRYVGYAAVAVLGLLVLLAVGTWLAVRAWGPELAHERVEAALSEALGRRVRIREIALQPMLGRVVVSDIAADALAGEPGPAFFTLGRVEVRIGVSSLWRRRLVVRTLELDDLDLKIGATKDGPPLRELPTLPEVVQTGWLEVELGAIELRGGRLLYDDAPRGVRVQARGLRVSARPGRDATSATVGADEIDADVMRTREHVEQLEAELRIAPTRLEASRLTGLWQKRRIAIAGRVDGPFDAPTVDVTARGDVDLRAIGRRVASPWTLAGIARVDARLQGAAAAPKVAGTVAVDELSAGPVKARAVAARATLTDGVLSVTRLEARAFEGSVTGSVVVALARIDDVQLTARLQKVSSAALEQVAGIGSGVTAWLDAEVDARGDLRDPARLRGRVRLDAREVRLPEPLASLGIGAVQVEGGAERGTFDLARAVASWPGVRLEAAGRATMDGPAPLRLKATADLAQLAPLVGPTPAGGDAVLDGEVTGGWRDPTLAARFDIRSPRVADVRADEGGGAFTLTRQALRVTAASVRLGQARLAASGNLSWPALTSPALPPPAAVSLEVLARTEGARLEDAAPWLPAALRGSSGPVGVTAKVDGTLAAWHVNGRAESTGVSLPSAPPVSDVSASFDATPERVEVAALRARVLDAPVSVTGRWRWAGSGEVSAEAGPVDLSRLPGVPEGLPVQGRARASASATVRDGQLAASGRINGEGVAVAGFPLGDGTADMSLDHGRLSAMDSGTVRGQIRFPGARIEATGEGRLAGAAVIAVRASATDLEIEPLVKQYRPDLASDLTGRLSMVATLDVPARDPRATRGVIRLEPVRFEAAGERWEARGPILVRRDPGKLTIERLELAGRLGTATVTGWLDDSGTIEGTVRGQAPLTLVALFRPEVREASGRLDLEVRIGGTTAKPVLLGRGTIADGLIALHDTPIVIRGIAGRIALSPARVRVEELHASVGSGTVRATGEIGLEGAAIGAYRVALEGRGLAVTALEGFETVWNADATLVGRGARGLVRGEAHLVRGTYTRDLSIVPLLLRGGMRAPPPEWGREIALQVDLHLDDNLVVRSPQARVRAGGRLLLQGSVAQPVVLGTIETQDGRITFRRNRFTLENAVVRFDDPRRLNPYLDVRATTRIRTYDVTMRLSGRADDLTIRLSSEPPLPQEDLLALVTLGSTRAELGSSAGLAFADEAAQLLSKELLGVEANTSFVDIMEFSRTDEGQSQFRVGKRLDDRTTVIYSGSFAEGGQQKLRIEYQLLGPLLLAGEQVFTGGFGGDVILRLRFR